MKVKSFINGLVSGRRENIIYYIRQGQVYARRYAIPGKKRKWEVEGRTPKQREVAVRFAAIQTFYQEYMKQVSPEVWRAVAKPLGKMAPNVFNSQNFHCFGNDGMIIDHERFQFSDGVLALPRAIRVSHEDEDFLVSWQEERNWSTAASTDRMLVGVLYDLLPLSPRLAVNARGVRGDMQGRFSLDESLGKTAHVYIFFTDEPGVRFSASYYTHV